MRGIRGALAGLIALTALAPAAPTEALPVGPPEVQISIEEGPEPFTYAIGAHARDPDGRLSSIRLCIDDGCWSEAEAVIAPLTDDVSHCLHGDTWDLEVEHTFPGPGTYSITASATGDRCPRALGNETTTVTYTLFVPEPPLPHEPVLCADPGTPTATAPGVDEETVTLAATVTLSGPHAPVMQDVARAMHAATRVINDLGGVCDRWIDLRLVDDGGDEQRRHQYVQNFIESGEVFALVAQDSAAAIGSGMLDEAGMPSVGTPARARAEFSSPWAWPIGAGNDAFGWTAVTEAYDAGARRFAVVYDSAQRWGVETAEAVEEAVASYDDATLVTRTSVLPWQTSYSSEIQAFNQACQGDCDAVIYALEPWTLRSWLAGQAQRGTIRDSLHPTLFNEDTAATCGSGCNGMFIWTDFHPPVGSAPAEATRFCRDLKGVHPTGDCMNALAESAYAAVFVAARAMGLVGVDLTRDGLQEVLDSSSFDLGLNGGPLAWTAMDRQANRWMRAYSIVVAQGSFAGFRRETDWVEDPRG